MAMIKRRPKGEGSITKLPNGNLKMTITLGVGADGKQKRRSVTAKTKSELMDKVTKLRVALGQPRETKMYFKELVETYLSWKYESMRDNTKSNYEYVKHKVLEPLYDYRVDKITPELIDEVLDKVRKKNGEIPSIQTMKTLKSKLSALFNFAVSRGIIGSSPLRGTRKRMKPVEKVNRVLIPTTKEMRELLKYTKERDEVCNKRAIKLYPLFLLAVATGMRIGEILDIDRERDIDVENHTISINSQTTKYGHNQELKTPSSHRVIFVQADILEAVLEAVPVSPKTTKLWHYRDRPINYKTMDSILSYFFKDNDKVPEGFTFHCFRHYHATQLLLKGINVKEVSKRLGHAKIQTTLDLYAHWVPEMDESAANIIGNDMII